MRRALRITIVVVVIVAALLAVNAIVLDSQTRPAEQTAAGGKLIELDNVTLQYVDRPARGSGPEGEPIVLLHCLACSGRWWDPLSPALNRGHRVIALDLIGHGGSGKPSSGYEVQSQSAAVADALNKLQVRRAIVVGHGLGGLVATSLAEQSSELVDRLVLIGTASGPGEQDLPALTRASTAPALGEAIWRLKLDSMVKSAYGSYFAPGADVSGLFDDPDRVVEDVDAMTYKSYKQSELSSEDFLDAGSTASRLQTIGVPVLAMDGTEDRILDAKGVLADYQAVPGSRIVAIEGAGNSPDVEQPQEVADAILRFAGTGPAAPPPAAKPQPKANPRPNAKPRTRTSGGNGTGGRGEQGGKQRRK